MKNLSIDQSKLKQDDEIKDKIKYEIKHVDIPKDRCQLVYE
jgi:hypothetical protein